MPPGVGYPAQPEEPDIGSEIESVDERRSSGGPLRKFFSDPANIASALIFGAALTQDRKPGQDPIQALAERAAGATVFRGALQSGMQQRKIDREQMRFEQDQARQQTGLQRRQVATQERGVGLQERQLQQQADQFGQAQSFDQLMQEDEQAHDLERLELQGELQRQLQAATAKAASSPDFMAAYPDMSKAVYEALSFQNPMIRRPDGTEVPFLEMEASEQFNYAGNLAYSRLAIVPALTNGDAQIVNGNVNLPDDHPLVQQLGLGGAGSAGPAGLPSPKPEPGQADPKEGTAAPVAPSPFAEPRDIPGELWGGLTRGLDTLAGMSGERMGAAGKKPERVKERFAKGEKQMMEDIRGLYRLSDRVLTELGFDQQEIAQIRKLGENL